MEGRLYAPAPAPPQIATPEPADLVSLRARLADHVERARQIGFRVHDIGDTVFGSRSEAVGHGIAGADRPPSSLADLVNDLDQALNRICNGLDRL